jgi:hypothetical protein
MDGLVLAELDDLRLPIVCMNADEPTLLRVTRRWLMQKIAAAESAMLRPGAGAEIVCQDGLMHAK